MNGKMVNKWVNSVKDEVIQWRRHLHQYPELSYHEEKTSQFVYDLLCSFENLEVSRPTKTSVMARLIGSQPGQVLAFRADMDALPITEETNLDFASRIPGVMHACGHDGHTAMLLGAAKILNRLKDSIQGEIRFLFQHAEEVHPGGAKEMIQAGVLEGVDQIIGVHLMPHIPVGKMGFTYGPATAYSDRFDIKIQGRGGHGSEPHKTIDPIAVGSQIITNLQHIVSRNTAPMDQLVISVTKFHGGDAYNVIPDTVSLGGTVRIFNPELHGHVRGWMERVIKGVAEAHSAQYEFDYRYGYKSVLNDERITKIMEDTVSESFGKEAVQPVSPMMGGEDFSAYSHEVPASFILVGAGNVNKGTNYPLHHPRLILDEDALENGVRLFVHAAGKFVLQETNHEGAKEWAIMRSS
ncbi:M20 metallopeptidase family protein [Neobacillus sp. M.A.Huq-85]